MALLAVAGLLRPEAWVLAGAVLAVVWAAGAWACSRSRRSRRCSGAWSTSCVTGDPLYSLHATSELADELNRTRGIGAVPGSFVSFVSAAARPPVVARRAGGGRAAAGS